MQRQDACWLGASRSRWELTLVYRRRNPTISFSSLSPSFPHKCYAPALFQCQTLGQFRTVCIDVALTQSKWTTPAHLWCRTELNQTLLGGLGKTLRILKFTRAVLIKQMKKKHNVSFADWHLHFPMKTKDVCCIFQSVSMRRVLCCLAHNFSTHLSTDEVLVDTALACLVSVWYRTNCVCNCAGCFLS